MFDIVGLGENSVDEVYRVPALPHPGTSTAKLRVREHTDLRRWTGGHDDGGLRGAGTPREICRRLRQ